MYDMKIRYKPLKFQNMKKKSKRLLLDSGTVYLLVVSFKELRPKNPIKLLEITDNQMQVHLIAFLYFL